MPVYAGASGVSGYIRLTLSIYNSAGTLQNATAVVATVILPDGTTYVPGVVNDSAGLYHFDYTPAQVGHYGVYWVATGTNAGTLEESFNVDDLTISPPLPLSQVKSHLNIVESSVVDDDELRLLFQELAQGEAAAVVQVSKSLVETQVIEHDIVF